MLSFASSFLFFSPLPYPTLPTLNAPLTSSLCVNVVTSSLWRVIYLLNPYAFGMTHRLDLWLACHLFFYKSIYVTISNPFIWNLSKIIPTMPHPRLISGMKIQLPLHHIWLPTIPATSCTHNAFWPGLCCVEHDPPVPVHLPLSAQGGPLRPHRNRVLVAAEE